MTPEDVRNRKDDLKIRAITNFPQKTPCPVSAKSDFKPDLMVTSNQAEDEK